MYNHQEQNLDAFNVQKFIFEKKSSSILIMIPDELKNKYTVLSAVQANGLAIRHAPVEFLSKKVMEAAVLQDYRSFNLIPTRLVYQRLVVTYSISLLQKLEEFKS